MEFRIGQGYDVHRIEKNLKMWLCGVQIESDTGFVAHSDGDVAIHALCDALLGARAMGDIGKHFPDTDDRWKGIDSKLLLKKVCELVCADGWCISNVDITIALQAPKLAPYIEHMRSCLSSVMSIQPDRVSVKATTTEKLGFVGQGLGCAVWAVASICK